MSDDVTSLRIKIHSEEVDTAKKRLEDFARGGKKAEDSVKSLGANMANGMRTFVAGAVTVSAFSAVVGASVANWQKYDKAMKEVSSIMGGSRREFQELRGEVIKLSTALGVDATVAAKGLYQAVSAGIPKDNALDFLATASKVAIAGVTDVETSVDVLTNVINAYKLPVSEASVISDKLFSAIVDGKTTMEELSKSMSKGTVPAAALGVNLDELLSSIVAITLQGTPTTEAFTQVNATITALLNPSDELNVALAKIGFTTSRAAIQSLGYGQTLEKLRTAIGNNDAELVKAFRSTEAFKGVLSQTGVNLASFNKAMEDSAKSAGMSEKAYQTNANTLEIAQNQLSNSFTLLVENFESEFGTLEQTGKFLKGIALSISGIRESETLKQTSNMGASLAAAELPAKIEELKRQKALLESKISNSNSWVETIKPQSDLANNIAETKQLEEALGKIPQVIKKEAEAYNKLLEAKRSGNAELIQQREREYELTLETSEKEKRILDDQKSSLTEAENLQKLIDDDKAKRLDEIQKKQDKHAEELKKTAEDAAAYDSNKVQVLEEQVALTEELLRNEKDPERLIQTKAYLAELQKLKADEQAKEDFGVLPPKVVSVDALKDQLELDEEIRNSIEKRITSEEELLFVEKERLEVFAKRNPLESVGAQEAIAAIDDQISKLREMEAEKISNDKREAERNAESERQKFNGVLESLIPTQDSTNQFELEERELLASHERRKEAILEITIATQEEKNQLVKESEVKLNKELETLTRTRAQANFDAVRESLDNISSIQGAFGEKGFRVAQAAAIASATMSMFESAVSSYGAGAKLGGPVVGSIFAATALAAGAANIAQIKSQSYAGAFEFGGSIPNGQFGLVGEAGPEFVRGPAVVTSARTTARQRENEPNKSQDVSVTVHNYGSEKVETRTSFEGDKKMIDLIIGEASKRVAQDISKGGTPVAKAIESIYPVRRGSK